jgi:hypothetical protein
MLNSRSATERLLELTWRGVVSAEEVDAWKDIRNASVHARMQESAPSQEMAWKVDATMSMVYRLALHVIGWKGKRTDYSTRGWPTVSYPELLLAGPPESNQK